MSTEPDHAFWADRTDEDDAREKAEDLRGLTQNQRGEILVALCRMASEQIAQHPDPRERCAGRIR
ncbi:MAG: hypothetical protein R3F39_25350 [Myxococcota bacterium]